MENTFLQRHRAFAWLAALVQFYHRAVLSLVPENCRRDPNHTRSARMVIHFGLQGFFFGTAYAAFYAAIGHRCGAEIVVICTVIFAATPFWLKRSGHLRAAGHILVGTMTLGFNQLTLVEGGVHSHAIAWLASVPICALLILGVRPACAWAGVCLFCGVGIGTLTLLGVEFKATYDPRWRDLVDTAGNLGITIFLFVLGLVFELSRAEAFARMRASLDELATSNDELARLNNEKTEFLGIAAHDLRNPLSAVIGFAEILETDSTRRTAQMASTIARAGRRMLELINSLLDNDAIESGRYASERTRQDLRELATMSIGHNARAAERKQIVLHLAGDRPVWVMANSQATLQVMDNLISNAVKYSPLGTRVTISLASPEPWGEFSVLDEGPGLSEEDQKKLFQRHTKLSARPTGGESSVGLGLSIVKRLAETMQGSVRCESELGKGCRFILRLLRATEEPAAISLALPTSVVPMLTNKLLDEAVEELPAKLA